MSSISFRLIQSFVPRRASPDEVNHLQRTPLDFDSSLQNIKPELYGPSMIAFTLAAILIYQMKLSSQSVVSIEATPTH